MICIRVPRGAEQHVTFGYSPLLECVLSLHVLLEPKHHALHQTWVREMRAADRELRGRIETFGFLYRYNLPDLFVPDREHPTAFEEELERLCRLPASTLLEGFGRPLFDHGGHADEHLFDDPRVRDLMLRRAASQSVRSRALAELLLDDPQEFARRFAAMLRDYWRTAFGGEWERVRPLLAESVTESRSVLEHVGVWPALGRLPPHCLIDSTRSELRVDLPHEHTVTVSGENPLILTPSVFVWPHLRVSCDAPWPTALVYTAPAVARDAEPRVPPSDLVAVLDALADDTRLRVLKLVAERPRTTQELAALVGLSMAGLSKALVRSTNSIRLPSGSLTSKLLKPYLERLIAVGTATPFDAR